jgi:hypothetical protein
VTVHRRWDIARHAVRTAFRVYRSHPFAIAGIAAVVFAPLALLDAFGSAQAENLFNTGGGNVALGAIVLAAGRCSRRGARWVPGSWTASW